MSFQQLQSESAQVAADNWKDSATCVLCPGKIKPSVTGLFDTRFGIPGEYTVWKCSACGVEQLYPFPTPPELKELYESHYNFGGEKGTLYVSWREWFFASWIYRLWVRIDGDISFHTRRGDGRLLDIGCNQGRGLKIYARNGYQVEGLELNETAAAVARESGIPVHTTLLSDLDLDRHYDVAVLSNVLEHSLAPKAMLLDAHRVLKKGGQVWISCPNAASILRSLFGSAWINWHIPFHTVHFSPQSLRKLLTETGFQTIEMKQITPALWVTSSIISWAFAHRGKPTRQFRSLLVVATIPFVKLFSLPFIWLTNRLGRGDCLVCVAVAE